MRTPTTFHPVNQIIEGVARKHGVRIYEYANVGHHLHLLIKIPKRGAWNAFIRELTGRIARLTKTRWLHRPFTRVVAGWRKAFEAVREYLRLNEWEAARGIDRRESVARRRLMREMGYAGPFW